MGKGIFMKSFIPPINRWQWKIIINKNIVNSRCYNHISINFDTWEFDLNREKKKRKIRKELQLTGPATSLLAQYLATSPRPISFFPPTRVRPRLHLPCTWSSDGGPPVAARPARLPLTPRPRIWPDAFPSLANGPHVTSLPFFLGLLRELRLAVRISGIDDPARAARRPSRQLGSVTRLYTAPETHTPAVGSSVGLAARRGPPRS
jgi:hypothetical protein